MLTKYFQLDQPFKKPEVKPEASQEVSGILVDPSEKPVKFPASIKNAVQGGVYSLLKKTYFDHVPLGEIVTELRAHDVYALQEDGTEWAGFLVGGAACGTDEASKQNASIDLAIKIGEKYFAVNSRLYISWCKMPSGKYEVLGYLT